MSILRDWRAQVRMRTESPWPGPRPMDGERDKHSKLVGRRDDAKEFARLVYDTDVVVFTGASGVGKSSMLQLELVPTLRKAGYRVLVCSEWNGQSGTVDIEELIQRQAARDIPARVRVEMRRNGQGLLSTLDALYPDRCVILLDQFEELLRQPGIHRRDVLRWIEAAAADTRVRFVISLRVEYEHELRGLYGMRLGPFQQARYELRPIEAPDLVRQIIEGGNDGRPAPVIAKKAVDALIEAWEAAAGEDDSPARRGLLHLQALLFVLWMTKEGDRIEATDLEALHRRKRSDLSPSVRKQNLSPASILFAHALTHAVDVALDQCAKACDPREEDGWAGVDPVLASRTRDLVQAMSSHLSSGGFKVSQSRDDLALSVIFPEGSAPLRDSLDAVADACDRLVELVDESWPELADGGDDKKAPDWLSLPRSELGLASPDPDAMPWDLDHGEVTAGVLLGLRPEDSIIEEFRSFYFGLEWLRLCDLVRITTQTGAETMVTLVHDLFGDGLRNWSSHATPGIESYVHQFTALRGVRIMPDAEKDRSAIRQPVVANLRWRSCHVQAKFREVTFVNCDFRGSTFLRCEFEGVAFVNCMLDDTEFFDCTIVGAPVLPHDSELPPGPPAFLVDHVPHALVDSLQRYHESRRFTSDEPLGLYSRTAGVAAIPVPTPSKPRELVVERQPGGLSLFGGRISSLKVRECDFGELGRMALCFVAGTSVEFADQTQARLDVYRAAIRGLTITRPLDADPPTTDDHHQPFDVTFFDSRIIDLWFGVGLSGTASMTQCLVWHVFNAAKLKDFPITISGSHFIGAVNVGPSDAVTETPSRVDSLEEELLEQVQKASRSIDYRRRPLRSELVDEAGAATEQADG